MTKLLALLPLLAFSPAASASTWFADAGLASGANDGTSWSDAFQGAGALQAAFAASVAGDEVFAAEGTYLASTSGVRTASFVLKSGVEVYGGFAGGESDPSERPPFGTAPSVLSGDLSGDDGSGLLGDNSLHVVNGTGSNATAVLDGFIVTAGNSNSSGNNNRGAGILCLSGASPTIRNCRFVANRCTFGGGAGYINGSAPSFTDCSFESNLGGSFGGAFDVANAGAVRFERCLFTGNSAARAGALELFATSGAVVVNSIFYDNLSTGSGGGGAIWTGSGGATQIRNVTVVANRSTVSAAAGLFNSGATPTVANSVFYDNEGPGGAQGTINQIAGTVTVSYSIVEGGIAGTGNLASDPMLADVPAGDFRPTAGSPAIDAGSNASVPAGVTLDFARAPRFIDDPSTPDTGAGSPPLVDMGAHEFQGTPVTAYCFGDGSGTSCPCGNAGASGHGCANGSFAAGCALSATGNASVANDTLVLHAMQSTPNQPGIFFLGNNAVSGGAGAAFGDGLRCAGGNVCRVQVVSANASGAASSTISIAADCGLAPGDLRRMQWWYRDPVLSPCGAKFNLSNGVEATWGP